MSFDFQARAQNLALVHQALERMKEHGFLVLSSEGGSIEGAGCFLALGSEARFLMDRPLEIVCFSTKQSATKWIAQTLLSILGNLGIRESFDTYYGPVLGCSAIYDEAKMIVEIN